MLCSSSFCTRTSRKQERLCVLGGKLVLEALPWEWCMIKGWKQITTEEFFLSGCTHRMQDLSFQTRDQAPCPLQWKYEVLTSILLGKSHEFAILLVNMWGCFLVPKEGIKYTFLTKTYQEYYLSSHAVLRLCSDAVMSDSLWPHRPYSTRLLCLWDFPSKTTRVGCHFLLQTQGSNLRLLYLH